MPTRVRFAPSPTGYLHVGGARTALFNWLYARHTGGTMILRIEDTDDARNTPEANEAIFEGLSWLGLDWDEGPDAGGDFGPYRQSERRGIYDAYFARLEDVGLVYDDAGAGRFKAPNTDVTVDDLICGPTAFTGRGEPDMTLRRPHGSYIFHFVSVVDDIEMEISHVIRGEDHLSNTPRHLDLYAALGATPPRFAHIPLILNQDGSKMSKRDRGASIREYIERGFLPGAVVNYLSLLGWSSGTDREIFSPSELIEAFDLADVNRANARFDMGKCLWMNQKYLQDLPDADFIAAARDNFLSHDLPDEALLLAKPRIETLDGIGSILAPIVSGTGEIDPEAGARVSQNPQNAAILGALAANFERIDWSASAIEETITATASGFQLKPGKIMFPLRVLATGIAHGTDLIPTLAIIGREETVRRLRARLQILFPSA